MDTPDGIVMFVVWLGSWGVLGVLMSGGGAQIWHSVNSHAEHDGCRLLGRRGRRADRPHAEVAEGMVARRRRVTGGGWRLEVRSGASGGLSARVPRVE